MLNLFFVFFLRVEIVYIRKMATSLVIDLLAKTKRAARVLFCFWGYEYNLSVYDFILISLNDVITK